MLATAVRIVCVGVSLVGLACAPVGDGRRCAPGPFPAPVSVDARRSARDSDSHQAVSVTVRLLTSIAGRCTIRPTHATPVQSDECSVVLPPRPVGPSVLLPANSSVGQVFALDGGSERLLYLGLGRGWFLTNDAAAVADLYDGRWGQGERCAQSGDAIERALAAVRMELGLELPPACHWRNPASDDRPVSGACVAVYEFTAGERREAQFLTSTSTRTYTAAAIASGVLGAHEVHYMPGNKTACNLLRGASTDDALVASVVSFRPGSGDMGWVDLSATGCLGWVVGASDTRLAGDALRRILDDAESSGSQ